MSLNQDNLSKDFEGTLEAHGELMESTSSPAQLEASTYSTDLLSEVHTQRKTGPDSPKKSLSQKSNSPIDESIQTVEKVATLFLPVVKQIEEKLNDITTRLEQQEQQINSKTFHFKTPKQPKSYKTTHKTPVSFTAYKGNIPSPGKYYNNTPGNPDPTYIPPTPNPPITSRSKKSTLDQISVTSSLNSDSSESAAGRKRHSILESLIASGKSTQQINTSGGLQYTRMVPPFDHIKLNDLSLKDVVKFINQIMDYEFRWGVPINMKAHIADHCFRRLAIKFHGKIDYQDQYKDMDRAELARLLFDYVRPETQSEFRQILENIKLRYNSNTITQEEYKQFYEALIEYSIQFLKWYEILADGTEFKIIPPCNNKDKGLIKIFLSKLPGELGQELYAEIYKEYPELSDKNLKFQTFHKLFVEMIEKHNSKHISTRSALSMYANVGKIRSKDSNNSTPVQSKSNYSNHNNTTQRYTGSSDNSKRKSLHQTLLHNISEMLSAASSDVNSDNENDSTEREQSIQDSSMLETAMDDLEDTHDASINANSPPEHDFEHEIEDLNAVSNSSGQPQVCFSMIFYNRCDKPNCKYLHDGPSMYKAHAQYLELLGKSKYGGSSSQQSKRGILKPMQHSNQSQKFNNKTINLILPHVNEDNGNCSLAPDGYLHFIKKSCLDIIPGANLVECIVKSGDVHFNNGQNVTLNDILFDTGALHGNYVSLSWFNDHKANLDGHLVTTATSKVKLADNKTIVPIYNVVQLSLTFTGNDGQAYHLSDTFSVIDTTTSMIIGLPAIVTQLGTYFQNIISDAIDNFSSQNCMNLAQSNVEVEVEAHVEVPPWTTISVNDDAPEDLSTPLPCAFTEALHFMEVSYDQAKQDFIDLIPSHVSPEFSQSTPIVDLLMTKGLDVFIPRNWKGVQGVPPLKLEWQPNAPTFMKPKAWPINPRLYGNAEKECNRLTQYFYRKSNSPVASNLVIAPKATPPYIRFCGNYVAIGKYIVTGHYPIPRVIQSLEKIVTYSVFLDFDLANAFHQFKIDDYSSSKLSVQTPWGQFEPMFLPEGIPPASGELQKYMDIIFEPIKDYAIVIFDNLLVLATDFQDAYTKVNTVFDLCLKHNLFLKFSKTWLGFPEVKFFGYICRHKSYSLSQDRKDALQSVPFPANKKAMQSFLGAALFFKNFIPNYSSITSHLNDMLKKDFVWDPSQWKLDYNSVFNDVKLALQQASSIFYPNYELKWILRTDASDLGVGAVLLQIDDSFTPPQHQPIGFVSQKLSSQATRWSTIEKEAYAVYFGVKSFAYYLIGKPFVLQTDHANLQWMEASVVPKILRWRIYLQTFQFVIQHIPGKANTVADWLSRLSLIYHDDCVAHSLLTSSFSQANGEGDDSLSLAVDQHCYIHMLQQVISSDEQENLVEQPPAEAIPSPYSDPIEVLKQVHNSRMGHHGVRKTYVLLNLYFPGHRIPHRIISDFIQTCPTCQKERLGMVDNIRPMVKHLKPEHLHSAVGVDVLTITPADEDGNSCLIVVVNHFTKLVHLYPAKTHNATNIATALFSYISIYGLFDVLYSDPGSDIMSETVEHLNKWLGIRHKVSIVDRHQSNGVEGTNKQILKHLRALVYDERVLNTWSSPTVLPIIQYLINSSLNSETNMVPFELHFGQDSKTYHVIPTNLSLNSKVNEYILKLNTNLRNLLEVSRTYQQNLVQQRTGSDSNNIQYINQYQPGDYVLKQIDMSKPRPSKLHPQFLGPFEVITHVGNDIQAKSLITGAIKTFHVDMVKVFHGTREEAYRMAMIDNDQYEVDSIVAYRGDPETRTTMEFLVKYKDGDEVWMPYSKDISDTEQFESFCRSNKQLFYLLYNLKEAKRIASNIKSQDITLIQPGDTVYVDVRCYGEAWYKSLDLPNKYTQQYVVVYKYTEWYSTRTRKKIIAVCDVFNETWTLDNLFVYSYGHTKAFDPLGMVLVTPTLLKDHPKLAKSNN